MPRLQPSLLLLAYKKSPLLPLVLRGARTLESAINEFRWLREHVQVLIPRCRPQARQRLLELCRRRSKGEPLQYILGSQPFGELNIKCRPGVLIPRPETELYTTYLASLISQNKLPLKCKSHSPVQQLKDQPRTLKILDLCSGSGCISLLLHSLLSPEFQSLEIFGLDISPVAVKLAKENLAHNVQAGHLHASAVEDTPAHPPQVQFGLADIFQPLVRNLARYDIIISNPPYISRSEFATQTTRSVRNYEPKLALVPDNESSDVFYERLIRLHQIHLASVTVMEVGDAAQAIRVVEMAASMDYSAFRHAPRVRNRVEIWRDYPDGVAKVVREIAGWKVVVRGSGNIRAVVLFSDKTDRHEAHKVQLGKAVVERSDEPDRI